MRPPSTSSRLEPDAGLRNSLFLLPFSNFSHTPKPARGSPGQNQNQKPKQKRLKTLDGGSLGSSVDEERGQPRELMRIAGLSEHRHLERTLRLRDPLSRGPVRSRGGKLHVSSYCEKHLTVPARQPVYLRAVETGTSQDRSGPSSPALQTAESLPSRPRAEQSVAGFVVVPFVRRIIARSRARVTMTHVQLHP